MATIKTSTLKTYILYVMEYTYAAKSRGIISRHYMKDADRFCFQASSDDEAYQILCSQFKVGDRRPLAGRSYVKPRRFKVGDRVRLLQPYQGTVYTEDGPVSFTEGTVSEVISPFHISVEFKGYHTRFVDFACSEIR